MWDTVQTNDVHLSHDIPCARCSHDVHPFLACGNGCACEPVAMPGASATAPIWHPLVSSDSPGVDALRKVGHPL